MSTNETARGLGANYRKLFASSTAANLGDGIMSVALVWLASAITRDALLIGLVAVASRLPWLVFSLPAGVITDRFDRRRIVAWMDVVRFAVIAALGVLVLVVQSGLPTPAELAGGAPEPQNAAVLIAALCLASLLIGFAEVLRDNTAQTLMPAVVGKTHLEKANGRMWAAETTMNSFVGPPLGGVLVGLAIAIPFWLNAGLLAVSAVLVFALVGNFAPTKAAVARSRRIDWKAEMGEGFRWLWNHNVIRALALSLGVLNFLGSITFVVTVLFVQDVLGLYEGWQFGLATTGFAVGAVVGSLLGDRVSKRFAPGATLVAAIAGMGATTALMGLVPWVAAFWLFGVIGGVLVVVWNVITVSLRQRLIPDHLLGRVNSVYRFFGWGTMSVGTLLGGALVTWFEPVIGREWSLRGVFVIAGVAYFALIAYALRHISTAQIRAAEQQAERDHDAVPRDAGPA